MINQLVKEYENGFAFKQGRVKDWKKTEDLYFNRTKKNLKGRMNIPVPIMSGFIDTLLSKIDEPPTLVFNETKEADYKGAQKIQAMYERDKYGSASNDETDWHSKDIDSKKLACFYGRAIIKAYGESIPKYQFVLNSVDPYDFYIDPLGGGYTEDAKYLGEINIFRSKRYLQEMAQKGLFDRQAVANIINGENKYLSKEDPEQNKANRFSSLNLNQDMHALVSGQCASLVESGTTYKGERYYVLWSYDHKTILRKEKIKNVFKSGLWWWTSWATYRDKYNFWSKSPADDMRSVAQAIMVLFNQELENRQKNNWGMRAYDPRMFPNPAELQYRPDGLVAANPEETAVKQISQGIYEFTVPGLNGTIDLIGWMDTLIGGKTGITNATQGQSEDTKVGIYYGNLQQVADRLGLINKSYASCWRAIGRRYVWALHEHLPQKTAIKILGTKGVEWTELVKKEINPDIDISVKNTQAQVQADEITKRQQNEAITSIQANPNLAAKINAKWMIEQILMNAGYDQEQVRQALDVERWGNRELLSEAASAIDDIIAGKEPPLNYGANVAYIQKIIDYARNNTDKDFELFQRLVAFADAHQGIVMANMSRQLIRDRTSIVGGVGNLPEIQIPTPQQLEAGQNEQLLKPEVPVPGTEAGTASRSQLQTNAVVPRQIPNFAIV